MKKISFDQKIKNYFLRAKRSKNLLEDSIFPNNEVQYLHPRDGVFPEKLNQGRIGVGNIGHSIGKNPQPVQVKFTGKRTYD